MNCVRTSAVRAATRRFAAPRSAASVMQIRNSSDIHTADYQSPFVGATAHRTTKIPDFSKYRVPAGTARKNQVFSYFMVGTLGALSAAGAKATVQGEDILYPTNPPTHPQPIYIH
jgi:ubiquinol-cytochrome c reductase iron-sulfur subunit